MTPMGAADTLEGHVTIRFTRDMEADVARLAKAEGMTVGAWVRREVEREAARREQPQAVPETVAALEAEIDRLRELLEDIGVMAANAPEDEDAFGVCEQIAMRVAAIGVPGDEDDRGRQPKSASAELLALVDAHFIGNGPYPLQLVCLTEDASDVECGQQIAEVEPGYSWGHLEELIAEHAAECHVPGKPVDDVITSL